MKPYHFIAVSIVVLGASDMGVCDTPVISGVVPNQRPADMPVITAVDKDTAWYGQALHGVEQPYPYSLRFLEDQGKWFNPFLKAGMTGPYDIRNWH